MAPKAHRSDDVRESALLALGLRRGEKVRFRRRADQRWQPGTVSRMEKDGSVGLVDRKGAAVAIPVDGIEVQLTGPRGGVGWEPLSDRASRCEQLELFR